MSWAIWITGPPGSGKSAIARAVEAELRAQRSAASSGSSSTRSGRPSRRTPLHGPRARHVYRALGWLAALLVEAGIPVLIDATAHRRVWRDLVREAVPHFAEVQLVCPLEVCRQRERARPPGHAPRDIYAHAGKPGRHRAGRRRPVRARPGP